MLCKVETLRAGSETAFPYPSYTSHQHGMRSARWAGDGGSHLQPSVLGAGHNMAPTERRMLTSSHTCWRQCLQGWGQQSRRCCWRLSRSPRMCHAPCQRTRRSGSAHMQAPQAPAQPGARQMMPGIISGTMSPAFVALASRAAQHGASRRSQCEHDTSARHLMRQCRATGWECTCRIPLRPQKASSRGYALLMPKAMLTAAVAASPPAKATPSALSNAHMARLLVTGCFRQQRGCTRRLCTVPSLLM